MLDGVGTREGLFFIGIFGSGAGGAFGVDAEEDGEVEGFRDRLSGFGGGLEGGLADGGDGIFIEAEADGSDDGDFGGAAVGADDGAVEGAPGDGAGLGVVVGVGGERGEDLGLLVDGRGAEDAGVGGSVVDAGGLGLEVELPELGHGSADLVVDAVGEDAGEGFVKDVGGVGRGRGGGDAQGVGGSLSLRGGGKFGLGLGCLLFGGGLCGGGAGLGRLVGLVYGGFCAHFEDGFAVFIFGCGFGAFGQAGVFDFFGLDDLFAVNGDFEDFLLWSDFDAIDGLAGVFIGQSAEEVEAVACAFELDLVLGEMDFLDLDAGEGPGAGGGVVEGVAMLGKREGIAEIASAEIEFFADEEVAELFFGDAAGLFGGGLDGGWRIWGRQGGVWCGLRAWLGSWGGSLGCGGCFSRWLSFCCESWGCGGRGLLRGWFWSLRGGGLDGQQRAAEEEREGREAQTVAVEWGGVLGCWIAHRGPCGKL